MRKFFINLKSDPYLTSIILIAFSLRIFGIFWGLPDGSLDWPVGGLHPDEGKFILGAARFPLDILINTDLRYPTAGHYILGILTLPIRVFVLITSGSEAIKSLFPAMFFIGRLLSVFSGTASIFLTYLLSKLIFSDRKGALLSSIFLTFAIYHVTDSAYATSDSAIGMLFLIFIYFTIKSKITQKKLYLLISGISLGLVSGFKYSGISIILIIPIWFLFENYKDWRSLSYNFKKSILFIISDSRSYLFFISALFIFILTTPGILIHPLKLFDALNYEFLRLDNFKSQYNWTDLDQYKLIFNSILTCVGLPLFITSTLGIFLSLKIKNNYSKSIIVFIVFYFTYVVSAGFPRYVIPVTPLLAIYSGFLASELTNIKLSYIRKLSQIFIIFLIILSIANVSNLLWQRYPDTRPQSINWILKNIPQTNSLGYSYPSFKEGRGTSPGGLWHLYRYPINSEILKKYNLIDFLKSPDYLITNSEDIEYIQNILNSGLVDNNYSINYIPKEKNYLFYRNIIPEQEILKFYVNLEKGNTNYSLIKTISPKREFPLVKISMRAPEIKIYAKNNIKN